MCLTLGRLFGADPGSFCEDPVVIQGDGCSDVHTMGGTQMWFLFTATNNSHLFQVTNLDTLTGYVESVALYPAVCASLPLFTATFGHSRQLIPLMASGLAAGNQYLLCVKRAKPNQDDAIFTLCMEFWGTDGQATPCSNPCNLVCNGSFETFTQGPSGDCLNCASIPNQFDVCLNNHCWASLQVQECYNGLCAYFSTPDLGNVCTTYTCVSDPVLPHCGNSVVGLAVRGSAGSSPNNLYREAIIQRNLSVPSAGTYRVSYWIKRIQDDEVVNFGFWLTQSNVANGNFSITQTPSYSTPVQQGYGWTQITGFVTVANGGLYNLVIGSFNNTNLDLGISYFLIDDIEMTVAPPNVNISPNPVCSSSPITIFADPGFTSYTWTCSPSINGFPATGNSLVIPPPIAPGTYTITLSAMSGDGCVTNTYVIQVLPGPTAVLTPPGPLYLCSSNASVLLSASTNLPAEIDWFYNPNSPNGPGNQNLNCHGCTTYSATQAGYYYFEVFDPATGCFAKSNVVHVIHSPLTLTMTGGLEHCAAANDGTASVSVAGTGPFTYLWSPGGQTTSSITGQDAGFYTVTVTDLTTGCSATGSTIIFQSPPLAPPVVTNNALNNQLCNGSVVTYTIQSPLSAPYAYTLTYSEPPLGVLNPSPGVYIVTWASCDRDVSVTFTVNDVNAPAVCAASSTNTVFKCCGCASLVGDVVMTGLPGSDDLQDMLNQYNPSNSPLGVIYNNAGQWTYNNTAGGTLYINGVFTINASPAFQTLTFAPGSKVIMGANAKIDIVGSAGFAMNINQTHVWAGCGVMWDGIYYSGSNKVVQVLGTATQVSLIEDARNALVSTNGGNYLISNAVFNKNYIGVKVGNYGQNHPGIIRNSAFTCRDLSSTGFVGLTMDHMKNGYQQPPLPVQCQYGQLQVSTYPQATLLPSPVPLSTLTNRSYAGVYIEKVGNSTVNPNTLQITAWTNIVIGAGVTPTTSLLNVFDNMDYGIYAVNSNVIVRNNHFQNLTGPTLFSRNMINYGVGVYGIYDALNQSKRIEVGANNSRNSFYNCNRGVDLNGYYHCEVKGNCFQSTIAYSPGSGTQSPVGNYAVFVKSGRYIFTDIVNNTVTNWAQGLVFFSEYLLNPSGVYTRMEGDMYIRNNTISPGASFTTQYVGTAIIAESLSMNCTGCSSVAPGQTYVQDNTITNAYNGIRIQGWARRSFTRDNTITIRYQPNFGPLPTIFQQAGIRVISNADPVVFRNHIFGNMATGNTAAKLQLRGIYCTINNGMRVRCNDMTDVGQCMVFQGSNIGDVWDNIMNNATDGLVLINGGIIGHQTFNSQSTGIPSANIWNGPFANSQTLVDNTSFAMLSKLYVNPGNDTDSSKCRPSW